MSATTNCACPCPTPEIVTVPGAPGTDGTTGTAGTNGINAYTTTTTPTFNLPGAPGPTGLINVAVSSWMAIDQIIIISDPTVVGNLGHFQVLTIPSSTGVTLQWLQYPTDAAPGTPITSGSQVSPAGVFTQAAPLPTALTDNSTGTASNTIAAGVGISHLIFETQLTTLANAAFITTWTPGYAFKILAIDFIVDAPATTAAKLATLTTAISGVNITGGVLSLTSANCTPTGTVVPASAVTALNTGSAAATITITGSAVTPFAQGNGWIAIRVQNMDSANAIASLADHVNDLITALT